MLSTHVSSLENFWNLKFLLMKINSFKDISQRWFTRSISCLAESCLAQNCFCDDHSNYMFSQLKEMFPLTLQGQKLLASHQFKTETDIILMSPTQKLVSPKHIFRQRRKNDIDHPQVRPVFWVRPIYEQVRHLFLLSSATFLPVLEKITLRIMSYSKIMPELYQK